MPQYEPSARVSEDANAKSNIAEMLNPAKSFAVFGVAAQNAMRGNMELVSFASRRARAQMDLPRKAMACRSAAEFGQLGAAFWHEAFQDLVDCNQRLLASWTQSMTDAGQGGLARSMSDFATNTLRPMETATEEAGAAMAEHPTEPWAWWRTDLKGLKSTRNGNGHHTDHNELRVGP